MSEERAKYVHWAESTRRADEIGRLSLDQVRTYYKEELDRLEALRETIPVGYRGQLAEAIATTRDLVQHADALEKSLRYQWGVVHFSKF